MTKNNRMGATSKRPSNATAATDDRTGNVDPSRPGRFDLASFVDGKLKPYRKTKVTPDPELAMRLDGALQALALVDQAIAASTDPEGAAAKNMRLASKLLAPAELIERKERITAEVAELHEEFSAESWIEVRFDAIGARAKEQVRAKAAEAAKGKPLDLDIMLAYFAECGKVREATDAEAGEDEGWVSLTAAQWEVLVDAIGQTQADHLDALCGEVVHGGMVSPDFSQRLSAYRLTLAP